MAKRAERLSNTSVVIQSDILNSVDRIFGKEKKVLFEERFVKKDKIIYLLYLMDYLNSQYREEDRDNIVRLNAEKLSEVLSSNYKINIDFLIYYKFIAKEHNYNRDKGISNQFKLNDKYLESNEPFVEYPIDDLTLCKRLNYKGFGISQYHVKRNQYCKRERPHLVKYFNGKLNLNIKDAIASIVDLKRSKYRANYIIIHEYKYRNWKYSIKKDKDNRLHTILTRTNKKLLKHIDYNGKKLSEIDIKSSQPLFYYCVLNALYGSKENSKLKDFVIDFFTESQMIELLKLQVDKDELEKLGDVIVNKDLYDFVASNITIEKKDGEFVGWKYNKKKNYTEEIPYESKRDLTKGLIMVSFYGSVKKKKKQVKEIENLFPTSFKVIDRIKDFSNEKNYFSSFLQKLEAEVLLDIVAKKISEEFPNSPLFSKHDSLITISDDADDIKKVSEKHFVEAVGVENIKFKLSHWK